MLLLLLLLALPLIVSASSLPLLLLVNAVAVVATMVVEEAVMAELLPTESRVLLSAGGLVGPVVALIVDHFLL